VTFSQARWLGLPADDIYQALCLAQMEGRSMGAALDGLARALGWRRVRMPCGENAGARRWVREPVWLGWGPYGYRQVGGQPKRAARMKIHPERRNEIARMGARVVIRRKGEVR